MAKKPRICIECNRQLPFSLFSKTGKTCYFCKFPLHNPLKDLLEQKDNEISQLRTDILTAQDTKILISQDINILIDQMENITSNMAPGKWEVKKGVYFQTLEQSMTANLLADRWCVDRSMAISAVFEFLFRALPQEERNVVETWAEKERRWLNRQALKSKRYYTNGTK